MYTHKYTHGTHACKSVLESSTVKQLDVVIASWGYKNNFLMNHLTYISSIQVTHSTKIRMQYICVHFRYSISCEQYTQCITLTFKKTSLYFKPLRRRTFFVTLIRATCTRESTISHFSKRQEQGLTGLHCLVQELGEIISVQFCSV